MSSDEKMQAAGEGLVKQDLITQADLESARATEAESGVPWYKQLLQSGKVSFGVLEDALRYEFHSQSDREEHQTLGEFLVEMGDLTKPELQDALKEQKRTGRLLGNILIERGHVTREHLTKALSRQHNLEFVPIQTAKTMPAAIERLPKHVAKKYEVIPYLLEGDRLTVLIGKPQTSAKLKDLGLLLGLRVHPMLTASDDFATELDQRYVKASANESPESIPVEIPKAKRKRAVLPTEDDPAPEAPTKPRKNAAAKRATAENNEESATVSEETQIVPEDTPRFDEIAKAASGGSVVKIVSTILEGATNARATDIHLDPQDEELRVRYRIDGILHDVMAIPEESIGAVISRVKIMSDLDITNTRLPQDGHISMEIGEREFDVRVATLPTFLGERVVMRLLDQDSVVSGVKDIGLEDDDTEKLLRVITQPYGMVLVTGPTGSGKTTSLYAMLNQKNVLTESIVTLEDPVEYQIAGINQVQIDPDIDLTFANTLRASLRQDIDVLLVGEIRDPETARIATRAAMTGHLVFSTLHTNDAPEAISTLRNMEVPSFLISSALSAVIAQRLVRKICPSCKKGFKPSGPLLKSLGLPASTKKLYRGEGCDDCYGMGDFGRTGIFEILEVTPEIRKLIADDASVEQIQKAAKLKTMAMRCRDKVKRGEVNPEEFLRVIRT